LSKPVILRALHCTDCSMWQYQSDCLSSERTFRHFILKANYFDT